MGIFPHLPEILPAPEEPGLRPPDREQRARRRHLLPDPADPQPPRVLPPRPQGAPRGLGRQAEHRGLVPREREFGLN